MGDLAPRKWLFAIQWNTREEVNCKNAAIPG